MTLITIAFPSHYHTYALVRSSTMQMNSSCRQLPQAQAPLYALVPSLRSHPSLYLSIYLPCLMQRYTKFFRFMPQPICSLSDFALSTCHTATGTPNSFGSSPSSDPSGLRTTSTTRLCTRPDTLASPTCDDQRASVPLQQRSRGDQSSLASCYLLLGTGCNTYRVQSSLAKL